MTHRRAVIILFVVTAGIVIGAARTWLSANAAVSSYKDFEPLRALTVIQKASEPELKALATIQAHGLSAEQSINLATAEYLRAFSLAVISASALQFLALFYLWRRNA